MKFKSIAAVLTIISSFTFSASAQLWNLDFNDAAGVMTGAGVVGSAGDVWNVATIAPSATPVAITLSDSTGDAGNSISLTYTGNANSGAEGPGTGNPNTLMGDYFRSNVNMGGGTSAALMQYDWSGFAPNTTYNVVAYAASTAGTDRGTIFFGTIGDSGSELGKTTGSVIDIFDASAEGNAYTTFSITSDGVGAVTFYSNFNSATSTQSPVNGFQISAVPEPATFTLAGFGLLTLALARRKR